MRRCVLLLVGIVGVGAFPCGGWLGDVVSVVSCIFSWVVVAAAMSGG